MLLLIKKTYLVGDATSGLDLGVLEAAVLARSAHDDHGLEVRDVDQAHLGVVVAPALVALRSEVGRLVGAVTDQRVELLQRLLVHHRRRHRLERRLGAARLVRVAALGRQSVRAHGGRNVRTRARQVRVQPACGDGRRGGLGLGSVLAVERLLLGLLAAQRRLVLLDLQHGRGDEVALECLSLLGLDREHLLRTRGTRGGFTCGHLRELLVRGGKAQVDDLLTRALALDHLAPRVGAGCVGVLDERVASQVVDDEGERVLALLEHLHALDEVGHLGKHLGVLRLALVLSGHERLLDVEEEAFERVELGALSGNLEVNLGDEDARRLGADDVAAQVLADLLVRAHHGVDRELVAHGRVGQPGGGLDFAGAELAVRALERRDEDLLKHGDHHEQHVRRAVLEALHADGFDDVHVARLGVAHRVAHAGLVRVLRGGGVHQTGRRTGSGSAIVGGTVVW